MSYRVFFTGAQLTVYLAFLALLAATCGDPDLIDAAVFRLMECP